MSDAAERQVGGFDGTRATVESRLGEDLVTRAAAFSPDLSAMVERPLADFVARGEARRGDDAALAHALARFDAFHGRHGLLSDEFLRL